MSGEPGPASWGSQKGGTPGQGKEAEGRGGACRADRGRGDTEGPRQSGLGRKRKAEKQEKEQKKGAERSESRKSRVGRWEGRTQEGESGPHGASWEAAGPSTEGPQFAGSQRERLVDPMARVFVGKKLV